MKNLFLTICLLLSFSAQAAISILSDLDDTIKITQAGGNATDIIGSDVFTAIPEFFSAASDYSNELHILSASPTFMESHILHVLELHKIDFYSLTLRANLFENKFDYKVREIQRIIESSNDDFILIGDDYGDDPEAYAEIARLYPNRILRSYIHVVKGRAFEKKVNFPYYTTADLFMREYLDGRMGYSWTKTALNKLISEFELEFIFPKKAKCPTTPTVWQWQFQSAFGRETQALARKLNAFCKQRRSDNILP